MSFEYPAKITVTSKMAANGEVYKKSFNGKCKIGVNKKVKGSIAQKAEAYLQAVSKSQGSSPPPPPPGMNLFQISKMRLSNSLLMRCY